MSMFGEILMMFDGSAARMEKMHCEKRRLKKQVDEWQQLCDAKAADYEMMCGQYAELETAYDEVCFARDEWQNKLAVLRREHESLLQAAEGVRRENSALRKELDELRAANQDLRRQLEVSEKQDDESEPAGESLGSKNGETTEEATNEKTQTGGFSDTEMADEARMAEDVRKAKLLRDEIDNVLMLETRTRQSLLNKCKMVGDVCGCTALELLDGLRMFGKHALNDLAYELWRHGLGFKDESTVRRQLKVERILAPARERLKTASLKDLCLSDETLHAVNRNGIERVDDVLRLSKNELRQKIADDICTDELLMRLEDIGFRWN